MVQFRPHAREVIAKIVYYGPPLGGKTTNLHTLYEGYPKDIRGELAVVPAGADRTIYFDFLPLEAGTLRNLKLRVQLYTVPGQVEYNSTRQLVLRGVDGVVFVADSRRSVLAGNLESWLNLKENLAMQGLNPAEMPLVIQYNKRDLPDILEVEQLDEFLNEFNAPFFEAVATVGIGVQETLQAAVKLVVRSLRDRFQIAAEAQVPSPPAIPPEAPGRAPGAPAAVVVPFAGGVDSLRSVRGIVDRPFSPLGSEPAEGMTRPVQVPGPKPGSPPPPQTADSGPASDPFVVTGSPGSEAPADHPPVPPPPPAAGPEPFPPGETPGSDAGGARQPFRDPGEITLPTQDIEDFMRDRKSFSGQAEQRVLETPLVTAEGPKTEAGDFGEQSFVFEAPAQGDPAPPLHEHDGWQDRTFPGIMLETLPGLEGPPDAFPAEAEPAAPPEESSEAVETFEAVESETAVHDSPAMPADHETASEPTPADVPPVGVPFPLAGDDPFGPPDLPEFGDAFGFPEPPGLADEEAISPTHAMPGAQVSGDTVPPASPESAEPPSPVWETEAAGPEWSSAPAEVDASPWDAHAEPLEPPPSFDEEPTAPAFDGSEDEVPEDSVEAPTTGEPEQVVTIPASALQRVAPRVLAQYGDVRELEIEVPVPALWTGGKRITLQLRMTLIPQEEDDGDSGHHS